MIRKHHDFLLQKKRDNSVEPRPSESFFSAVSSLIYNQLLSLITASKMEYMSLFRSYESDIQKVGNPRMPRFLMRVSCGKTTDIEYDPPLTEINEVIQAGLDFILHTMDSLPRPEYILYGSLCNQFFMVDRIDDSLKESQSLFANTGGPEIKVLFEPHEAESSSQQLKRVASTCFEKVQIQLKKYDQYLRLFSKDVEDGISLFLLEDHSFEDYAEVFY